MSVNPIFPAVFEGGQMTDLPVFTGTLNGTEVIEIVAAPAGQSNVAAGINYQMTTQLFAQLLVSIGLGQTVILNDGDHATALNPYVPGPLVNRIYVNKTIAEPTYISFAHASTYIIEPLVQDVAGTADAVGNGITVTFTGGETANGLGTVPITAPFGGYFFRPIVALNSWTLGVS